MLAGADPGICIRGRVPCLIFLSLFSLPPLPFRSSPGNSPEKLRHLRSDAYSAQQVLLLLNKQQIWCGGAYLDYYRSTLNQLDGLGSTVSSPSRVRNRAPAKNEFDAL